MPFFYTPPVDQAPSVFVQQASMTLAQLYANFAPTSQNQFMYARVSDLYSEAPAGQRGGVMVNETGGHWRPQRPDRMLSIAADADRVFTSLRTPPVLLLTGAVTVVRNMTFDLTMAYPGMPITIRRQGSGLLGVVLSGLGISLGVNGWSELVYDGAALKEVRSSGLL